MTVLIAGPTASGKSRLAMAVASARNGVVINADAMQVYRDLSIITARPTPADEAAVPHALYGHVDAATAHSVATWLADMAAVLDGATTRGQCPVIVGGTGLYLEALTTGLSPVPPVPDAVRQHWRGLQARETPDALHAVLAARDPVMAARVRPSDPQRIVRALEVIDATGRSLAEWQQSRSAPLVPLGPGVTALRLAPDRAGLRDAIAKRFASMVAAGAVEEAAALAARQLDPGLPAMKAIGLAPLMDLAAGRRTREDAIAQGVTDTRQFAKRQDTWLRGRLGHWQNVSREAAEAVLGLARPKKPVAGAADPC